MKPPVRRCAIYTRKSTEEGLEQDFNSLDAQREACHAYIMSQKSEGWAALKDHYDDGGFSGGNMDRPALKKLMEDIQAGKVHIVVVYKIDRLTRSLMDFAKLVDVFDKHGVTFVSVTQSFNTTTSMGRLTLNVLLSFAQFEREVTGERIRDKVAASKKKGMWMGGGVPMGYQVKDRALIPHPQNAEQVLKIFQMYLEVGGILALKDRLEAMGYRTRRGHIWSRGGLYSMLTNPAYIGKVRHKAQVYDGLHPAIISQDLWDAVQEKLINNPEDRGQKRTSQNFLLKGLVRNEAGVLYTPVFTNKGEWRYRYYVSRNKFEGKKDSGRRFPAQELENFVEKTLRSHMEDPERLAEIQGLDYALDYEDLVEQSKQHVTSSTEVLISKTVRGITLHKDNLTIETNPEGYKITAPFQIGGDRTCAIVIRPPVTKTPEDIFSLPPHRLKNLMKGIIWREEHFRGASIRGIARREKCDDTFVGRVIRESLEIV